MNSKRTASILILMIVTLAATSALAIGPSAANAIGTDPESELVTEFGSFGSGAGELSRPEGIATDPSDGTVYIADTLNNRVSVFTPFGEFIKAFGWGVADGTSQELQVCTSTCFKGLPGSEAGQFRYPQGIAVDTAGDLYVSEAGIAPSGFEQSNRRVQKFTPEGSFLLMFGGEVNKTTGENICTAAQLEGGDECGVGTAGTGDGQFDIQGTSVRDGAFIAVTSEDEVLVGDRDRIQRFGSDGKFKAAIALPQSGGPGSLAVDPVSGDIYFAFEEEAGPNVFRLDEDSGEILDELALDEPLALAVGPGGEVFAANDRHDVAEGEVENSIVGFTDDGEKTFECCPATKSALEARWLGGLTVNTQGGLYAITVDSAGDLEPISFVTLYGTPPTYSPPPLAPPSIIAQFASSVGTDSADLGAQINPHFWGDATYYVEYGTGECSEGGCQETAPVPPGDPLTTQVVNKRVRTDDIAIENLVPSTTYHYRFVAVSSGGGPVRGVGGAVGSDGSEGTFTTFPVPSALQSCPNSIFRTGPSAFLPDCRAYEMVSPVAKNNSDILALVSVSNLSNAANQSAVDGNGLTYSAYRSFGDSEAAPYTSQYIASRGATGWSSDSISPAQGPTFSYNNFDNEYSAFSADLAHSWLVRYAVPTLDPSAPEGFPNLYRRDNLIGAYQALVPEEPTLPPKDFIPELQGVSADGDVAIFRINDKLTADAKSGGVSQVYEARDGTLGLVCVFPPGVSPAVEEEYKYCSAGTSAWGNRNRGRDSFVENAISEDGSRVYWTASKYSEGFEGGLPLGQIERPGRLYLRVNGTTTVKVSEAPGAQSTLPARFWGAATDGSKAVFTITQGPKQGNLYRYDAGAGASTLIAMGVIGVVGISDDASRVYFVSEDAIGGEGTANQPNLYLAEGGSTDFIATLTRTDIQTSDGNSPIPSNLGIEPIFHAARVSADGTSLAFISTASLTGYDNTDLVTEKPDSEIFIYRVGASGPVCVSCNPTGARPRGPELQAPGNSGFYNVAAEVPPATNQLHTPRSLSADGSRFFFNSYDSLLPEDVNGMLDVYEWESADSGGCSVSSSSYFPPAGGCLYLISTGKSDRDSEFIDADPSGDNAFFATRESLLPQDPGFVDIYVARVGGGFPPPAQPPEPCVGEACQVPIAPPAVLAPSSTSARPGNPRFKPPCRKGTHRVKKKGKARCVKNGKKKRKAHNHGRKGR